VPFTGVFAPISEASMGFEVIEVQPTPNPNALKFVLSSPAFTQPTSFFDATAAAGHPVASRLFAIQGVESVLLLGDFITVNKAPTARWSDLTRRVKQTLAKLDTGN
jgi:hypothetical protein